MSGQECSNVVTTAAQPCRALERLDIVIPVFNEGGNILAVLDTLRLSVKTPLQILICYDRDDDTTLKALETYAYKSEMSIATVKNTGAGVLGAVKAGFNAGNADAVVVLPADDTFNADIIDRMVSAYCQGCEIVCASRFVAGGCMENCPWLKAVMVHTAAFLLYNVARLPSHDPTNGFRFYSRRVISEIPIETPRGWSFSLELLVKSHRRGWKVGEVPAKWFERTTGQSRFRIMNWLPLYLRWFFYAFQTSFSGRRGQNCR